MKKLSILLVALMLFLTGCGSKGEESSVKAGADKGSSKEASDTAKTSGYVFEANGVTIAMNAEAKPILKSLGKEQDYFEAKSCAFEDMDRTYTYSGFELKTYTLKGVEYVQSILFTDDSVSTKEGISIGSSVEELKKAYGDKGTESLGLYTYEQGKTKMSFITENDKVTSVEYLAVTE